MNTTNNSRYEKIHYDGKAITTKTITYEQAKAIIPQSADYFQSSAFGILAFRTLDDEWIEHRQGISPGLGDVCLRIIQALQLNPGEFLTPPEIAELTGRDSLRENNVLSARLMAIRKAHKECHSKPHFFLSRRPGGFAVAWNPRCSWIWLERI